MSVAMICMINQSAVVPLHRPINATSWPETSTTMVTPAFINSTQLAYNDSGWGNYSGDGYYDGDYYYEDCSGDARKLFDMNMTKPAYMHVSTL